MAIHVSQQEMDTESDNLFSKLAEYVQNQTHGPSNWQDLFNSYDSKFHQGANNGKLYYFRDTNALGSELNYYFEGQLFYLFNYPKTVLYGFMQTWKVKNYGVLPTAAAYQMADFGYDPYAMTKWSQHCKELQEWRAAHPRSIGW